MIDQEILDKIQNRDFGYLARLITRLENGDREMLAMVDSLTLETSLVQVVGITGLPGVGKSTLINQLLERIIQHGKTVAVVAVDPTSPFSGGAVLGDRVRMTGDDHQDRVFFRSMASRGHQGGVAEATQATARLLAAAGFDFVLIETVGAGQLQVAIRFLVATLVNVLSPEAGDEIQALKAGLMEVGDIFVINKKDLGQADRKKVELQTMLQHRQHDFEQAQWQIPVCQTNAQTGEGVDELLDKIEEHGRLLLSCEDDKAVRNGIREEQAPTDVKRGLVHVYTGEGKGKTTAALGLALRASGRDWRVAFLQFMKGGDYGETGALKRFASVRHVQFGTKSFVDKDHPGDEDRKEAKRGLAYAQELMQSGEYDLMVLDEIICAADFGLLDWQSVLDFVKNKPRELELVLTGRGASDELVALADYVTRLEEVKHPYQKGVQARKGVEY